ncbi:MAG: hypothetical protein AB7K09_16840 [Planctomycetota bacterium]
MIRAANLLVMLAVLVAFVVGPLQWLSTPLPESTFGDIDAAAALGGSRSQAATATAAPTDRREIIEREIERFERSLETLRENGAASATINETLTLLDALREAKRIWDATGHSPAGAGATAADDPLPLATRLQATLPAVLAADILRQIDHAATTRARDALIEQAEADLAAVQRVVQPGDSLDLALQRLLPAEIEMLEVLIAAPRLANMADSSRRRLEAVRAQFEQIATRDHTRTGLRMAIADGQWKRAEQIAESLERTPPPPSLRVRDTMIKVTTSGAIRVVPDDDRAASYHADWNAFAAGQPALAAAARELREPAEALQRAALQQAQQCVKVAHQLARLSGLRGHLAIATPDVIGGLAEQAAASYEQLAAAWHELISAE